MPRELPRTLLCEADLRQTRLKELMARQAAQVYVLAHAEKLGHAPFHAWAALPSGWTLVTHQDATPDQTTPFRDRGIRVVQVEDIEGMEDLTDLEPPAHAPAG